jgi:hypothetical protein
LFVPQLVGHHKEEAGNNYGNPTASKECKCYGKHSQQAVRKYFDSLALRTTLTRIALAMVAKALAFPKEPCTARRKHSLQYSILAPGRSERKFALHEIAAPRRTKPCLA